MFSLGVTMENRIGLESVQSCLSATGKAESILPSPAAPLTRQLEVGSTLTTNVSKKIVW